MFLLFCPIKQYFVDEKLIVLLYTKYMLPIGVEQLYKPYGEFNLIY